MIQSFADQTTADLFIELPSRAARRIPTDIWPVARRKLKLLDVARWEGNHAYEVRCEDYHA